MSETLSSPPRFNGANCNRINARIPKNYYDFKPIALYGLSSSGDVELQEVECTEYLGEADDFSLSSLLSAGISPQAVSSPSGNRLSGLTELIEFSNNNPLTTD